MKSDSPPPPEKRHEKNEKSFHHLLIYGALRGFAIGYGLKTLLAIVRAGIRFALKKRKSFFLKQVFFERDARDMQRLTGGNALFFRSRIRHAIAATDIKESSFEFDDKIYQST